MLKVDIENEVRNLANTRTSPLVLTRINEIDFLNSGL